MFDNIVDWVIRVSLGILIVMLGAMAVSAARDYYDARSPASVTVLELIDAPQKWEGRMVRLSGTVKTVSDKTSMIMLPQPVGKVMMYRPHPKRKVVSTVSDGAAKITVRSSRELKSGEEAVGRWSRGGSGYYLSLH